LAHYQYQNSIATAIASSKLLPVAVKAIAVLYCNQPKILTGKKLKINIRVKYTKAAAQCEERQAGFV
jgi:hypothetical protein